MTKRDHAGALDRVLALVVFLTEDASEGLAAHGLTMSRARVVWELHHRGPMTQKALADVIGVSPRNITGLVDALVMTGFVTREPHPTDRRAALVTLTEHGATIVDRLARDRRELAETLFSDWPSERFDCFVQGLDALLASLDEESKAAGRL